MAHHMNLVIGDVFKESDVYQQTSTKAVRIVSYFHSLNYFTIQKAVHGKTIA